jgi:hypothetical protein
LINEVKSTQICADVEAGSESPAGFHLQTSILTHRPFPIYIAHLTQSSQIINRVQLSEVISASIRLHFILWYIMDHITKVFFDPLATTKEQIRTLLKDLPVGSAHPFSPERLLLCHTATGVDEIDISSYSEKHSSMLWTCVSWISRVPFSISISCLNGD